MNRNSAWLCWSYVAYCFIAYSFTLGLPVWIVFVKGGNPHWMWGCLLAFCCYGPGKWSQLLSGAENSTKTA